MPVGKGDARSPSRGLRQRRTARCEGGVQRRHGRFELGFSVADERAWIVFGAGHFIDMNSVQGHYG